MPIYNWECKACGQSAEVIRPLSRFDEPPTGEEAPPPVEACGPAGHTWERIHTSAPRTIKGPSWGPGKGSWVLAFLLAGIGSANSACGRDRDDKHRPGAPGMTHEPPDDSDTDPDDLESTATGTGVTTQVVVTVTQDSVGGTIVHLPDGSTAQVQLGTTTGTSTSIGCK